MTLSFDHLKNVCLLGFKNPSKTCRYLRNDELDSSKWHCQKLNLQAKSKIDIEVDMSDSSFPSGDNCQGYPILKNITQGYDCSG
jgi:hypothetical protein